MPSYPVNSRVALEFSSCLAAICGGGISKSQSQQAASRAMKFLKFCSGKDELFKLVNYSSFITV